MKLIIFDLDQTLVDVVPVHDRAAEDVFRRFFNVKARLTEIDFAGKSLVESFLELGRLKGVPENHVRERIGEMLETYEERFVARLPVDASRCVLPGVKGLLQSLAKAGHLIALYTGDSERVAQAMLAATGLRDHFRLCFYGTQVKERADMVRLALQQAERLTGRQFRGRDIVIIGDSIRDVDCGRQFQALTIAVATGLHSAEELSARQPDYVFSTLKDYKAVLRAVG